jgi:thiol-disulfide isomerase/thioredoxin
VRKKNSLFFLCFLLTFSLLAQEVSIRGVAKSYAGKEMVVFSYQDLITFTRQLLETDTVKPDGSFQLRFKIPSTQRIYLRCDHLKAPLYAEPGRSYEVIFPDKDSSRLFNPNVEQTGDLNIRMTDTTSLNWLVMDFNARFDDFWNHNYQSFVIKQGRLPLDSFKRAIHKHYSAFPLSPYFNSYIDYSIASTQVSTFESQNFLARDYLYNRKIDYSNNEYMTFFNQFFDKYFYQFALKPEGAAVYNILNDKGTWTDLLDALKPAKYLGNDTLRELVMLKGLFENYNNREFSQSRILKILEQVSGQSKIPTHRLIARNIIARFSMLKRGTPAPAFTLADKNEKMHSLSDFKGKYLYLTFGASWCTNCISESKYLEELEKKYPYIQIVTIMTDDKIDDMKKLLKQNPKMNWTFLYGGGNEKLKHDYNLYAVPYYFLIGPDGKLLLSPAPGPYEGLEELFDDIVKKKENRYKVGEW